MDSSPPYKQALPRQVASYLPVVDQGCCCCPLRTCNLVQGWLSLVGSLINVLRTIWWMDTTGEGSVDIECDESSGEKCKIVDRTGEFGESAVRDTTMVITMILGIVTVVVSAVFLKGIRENKPHLMVHYIRMIAMNIALFLLMALLVAVALASVILFLVFAVFGVGLPTYFLICANSLYIKMMEELENPSAGAVPAAGYGFSPPPTGAPYASVNTPFAQ